ncbi:MAG: hypothetical protein GX542_03905 [Rhodococcus sp.]|nr:hypothetical protein [Rhodococcus sp. (in: high G+C Gram-positive bacteria)]
MTAQPQEALPPVAQAVVARWNPSGLRQLTADGVVVVGPPRSGKSAIEEELRRLIAESDAQIQLVEDQSAASVALMVLDASAALGREELTVLDSIVPGQSGKDQASGGRELSPHQPGSSRAIDVVFALNKIDVHQDWARVADRNAQLLAHHDPSFDGAVIHPVSARRSSGVDELFDAIVDIAAARRSTQQQQTNTQAVLTQTKQMIANTMRSVQDGSAEAALRAERTRVASGRDGGRAEQVTALRSHIQLAKVSLLHEVAGLARAATRASRADIDQADRRALATYPQRLAEQSAKQTAFVVDLVQRRIDQLAKSVNLVLPPSQNPAAAQFAQDFEEPDRRRRGLEDQMAILLGASAGLGLGRLVVSSFTLVPALDIASIPVTLLLGAAAAWWLMRARAHIADRAHIRQWAAESVAHVRGAWEQIVLARLLEAESQLSEQIIAVSRAHAAKVDERIAAIDSELRRLGSERAGKIAACEKDLEVLTGLG